MTTEKNTDCPKAIAAALLSVQAQVKRLTHDSKNDYANYQYVSIDAYYEAIRPWLNQAGILIVPNEVECQLSPDGRTMKTVLEFTILHQSGAVWDFPIRRTVYLPYTGAQSSGSALSYADKFVMRTLFKIPTGEYDPEAEATHHPDADAIAPTKKGQDSEVMFDFAGAPYRIFDAGKSVTNTFTDVRGWGLAFKKMTSKDADLAGVDFNQQEIKRIREDVVVDKSLTDKARSNLLKSIDSLTAEAEE